MFTLALVGLLVLSASTFALAQTLTIVSPNYAEPQILAEAVKIIIEKNTDLQVEHIRNFSSSTLLHAALTSGNAQMYVSYTGTQFAGVLGMEVTDEWKDARKVEEYVQQEFDQRFDATWFDSFGFNNTYALVIQKDFAEEQGIESITDLKEHSPSLTIAMDSTFRERAGDGYRDLLAAYDIEFNRAVSMDYGLIYRAVQTGDVDVAVAYSTDGRIVAMNLVALQDDQQYFPPYDPALVAANSVLDEHPEIVTLIEPLLGQIDEGTIAKYNQMVDVDYEEVEVAAQALVDDLYFK
jgi:osmoprotectant transport system substrate-binding protein